MLYEVITLNVIAKKFKGVVDFRKMDVRELTPETFAESAKEFDVVVSDIV